MLQLEILANELLLDIFEYLNTVHLIHAFIGLNSRFIQLLYTHFRNHELNFQSVDKQKFDVMCQKHLPQLTDYVIALRFSEDDETPNLCEIFLSYRLTLGQFINLKSLSLYYIDSLEIINEVIRQCCRLSHLNRLSLIYCCTKKWGRYIAADIINNIWSLPKLTHCTINDTTIYEIMSSGMTVVPSTIEYLSVNNDDGYINTLDRSFEYTSHVLQRDIDLSKWKTHDQYKIIFSSIVFFKTSFDGDKNLIIDVLQCMSNLCYLTLKTWNVHMNGYDWEKIIVNHLPKLKSFRLKMNFNFSKNDNICEHTDQLVDSFRTYFWTEEHHWYVQCNCYKSSTSKFAILYTLPYSFNEYLYLNSHYSKSTKPDESDVCSYNHVQYIIKTNITTFNYLNLLNTRYPNIAHYDITFPLTDHFDSCNLSFNRLISLTVKLSDIMGYHHLQTLLNRTNHLYSLKFDSFGGSPEGIFQLTSSSIRRLDLIVAQLNYGNFFNNEDCINLINSPLGHQCEVLVIEIENRINILDLIEKMPHLRILIFRLKDIILNYLTSPSLNKDIIRWLQKKLSSKSLIVTDHIYGSKICVWIYRKTNKSLTTNASDLTTLLFRFFQLIRQVFSLNFSGSN